MFDIGSVIVQVVLSLVLMSVVVFFATKKLIIPLVGAVVEEKMETAQGAIKRGYSAMGIKSQEVQKERAMEEALTEGIFEQYPELLAVAERISPDLVEMMQDDPITALRLGKRYIPILKDMFPQFFSQFEKEGVKQTQFEF